MPSALGSAFTGPMTAFRLGAGGASAQRRPVTTSSKSFQIEDAGENDVGGVVN